MTFSLRYLVVCLFTVGLNSAVHAGVDPACIPVIKASEARAAAPAWESVTVVSPNDFKMEAVMTGGQSYRRVTGGVWTKTLIDHSQAERELLAQINSGVIKLSRCKTEGSETLDGVATNVVSYTIEMAGAPAASAKLYVGKVDGLPYAQISAQTKTHFRYRGVVAPKL